MKMNKRTALELNNNDNEVLNKIKNCDLKVSYNNIDYVEVLLDNQSVNTSVYESIYSCYDRPSADKLFYYNQCLQFEQQLRNKGLDVKIGGIASYNIFMFSYLILIKYKGSFYYIILTNKTKKVYIERI